ncbi:MAG TPA: DUF3892 domain-containing protein [Bryobacteraceae bacterium]|nr:DUF3892 domain-containing protein [Bryobacteraceae bacterium]
MADVQVTCIIKPDLYSRVEHITHLGGPQWTWTREQVIDSIEGHTNTFFVIDPHTGARANVRVVRPSGRPAYVRTSADNDPNDNLLSLMQCPLVRT